MGHSGLHNSTTIRLSRDNDTYKINLTPEIIPLRSVMRSDDGISRGNYDMITDDGQKTHR